MCPHCSIENCLKPVYSKGICCMHYARIARYGHPGKKERPDWHRVLEKDIERMTCLCSSCGPAPLYRRTHGKSRVQWACFNKTKRNWARRRPSGQSYLVHKGDRCGKCGFVPVHRCQLDVDHIDGNHNNNQLSNLRTLCSNCHRLETHLHRHYLPIDRRKSQR